MSSTAPLFFTTSTISQEELALVWRPEYFAVKCCEGVKRSTVRDHMSAACRWTKMSVMVNEELSCNNMDFFFFSFFLISHSWFWPVLSSWGWQARRWNANLRDACEQCWSLSHCHSIYCTVSHGSAWVRGNSIWGMGPDFGALNVSFANTPQTAAL